MIVTTIYLSVSGVLYTFLVIIGVLSLPLYILPSIIAANKRYRIAILALNLLTGWTIIGWIIALIWSMAASPLTLKVLKDERSIENNNLAKDASQQETKTKNKEPSSPEKLADVKAKYSDDDIIVEMKHPLELKIITKVQHKTDKELELTNR